MLQGSQDVPLGAQDPDAASLASDGSEECYKSIACKYRRMTGSDPASYRDFLVEEIEKTQTISINAANMLSKLLEVCVMHLLSFIARLLFAS